MQLEVALSGEDLSQQRAHGGANATVPSPRADVHADARQVTPQALEAGQQAGGRREAGQTFQRFVALADELAGERLVAVEGGRSGASAARLLPELVRNLGAGRDLALEVAGGGLDVLGERCLQLD